MRPTTLRRLGLAAVGIAVLLLQYVVAVAGPGARVCVTPDCASLASTATCCGGCDDAGTPVVAPAADCGCTWLPLPDDRLPQLAVCSGPACTPTRPGSITVLVPPPVPRVLPAPRPAASPHLHSLRGIVLTC